MNTCLTRYNHFLLNRQYQRMSLRWNVSLTGTMFTYYHEKYRENADGYANDNIYRKWFGEDYRTYYDGGYRLEGTQYGGLRRTNQSCRKGNGKHRNHCGEHS